MAGPNDFTNQNIQDTYQRVLQTDGQNIFDGTGSAFNLTNNISITASHAQQAVTASHALFAISASHEITHELSTSYSQTADSASGNFHIGNNIYLNNATGQIFQNGVLMLTLQSSGQILPHYNVRTSDGKGIAFGAGSDYTIQHNSTTAGETKLAIKEGGSTRYIYGIGGHLTASSGVNIQLTEEGEFRGGSANITNITASNISSSGYVLTNELRGGGDEISLNVLGSITASSNISSSGTVYVKGSTTNGVYVNNDHALGTSTTVTEGAVFGDTSWTKIHIGRDGTNNKNIELHGPVTASGNISATGHVSASAFLISGSDGSVQIKTIVGHDGIGNGKVIIQPEAVNESGLIGEIVDGAYSLVVASSSGNTKQLIYSDTGHSELSIRSGETGNSQIVFNENGTPQYILGSAGADDSFQIRNSSYMTGGSSFIRMFSGSGFNQGIAIGPTGSNDAGSGHFHLTASGNISASGIGTFDGLNIDPAAPGCKTTITHQGVIVKETDSNLTAAKLYSNTQMGVLDLNYAGGNTNGIQLAAAGDCFINPIAGGLMVGAGPSPSDPWMPDNTMLFVHGNISSSGVLYANHISTGSGELSENYISITGSTSVFGNVTASGHISGSLTSNLTIGGDIIANKITLTENGFQNIVGPKLGLDSVGQVQIDSAAGTIGFSRNGTSAYLINPGISSHDFTGHITASGNIWQSGSSNQIIADGNISASGHLYGSHATITGTGSFLSADISSTIDSTGTGTGALRVAGGLSVAKKTTTKHLVVSQDFAVSNNVILCDNIVDSIMMIGTVITDINQTGDLNQTGNIFTSGHISASGDISSSGVLYVNHISTGSGELSENYISITGSTSIHGNVTASGNFKAAGHVSASNIYASSNISSSGNIIATKAIIREGSGGGLLFDDDGDGIAEASITHTGGGINLFAYGTNPTSATHLFVTQSGGTGMAYGKVGIGTMTPDEQLEVVGNISASGTISGLAGHTQHDLNDVTTGTSGSGDIVKFGTGTSVPGKIYHYKSDGSWELAVCTGIATCDGMLAVALGENPDVDGMLLRGMCTLHTIQGSQTVGDVLYLSETAGGTADCVAPSAQNEVVRIIGYNLHASSKQIWFCPDNTWVEIA